MKFLKKSFSRRRRNKVKAVILENIYKARNIFGVKKVPKKERPQLIVSLTTHAGRVDRVFLTIESIFNQSLLPDRLILWLSKEEFSSIEVLPDSIHNLVNRGLDLRFVDENIKSYKKLIYTLAEYPDAVIVTADDDILYPGDWLKTLYARHLDDKNAVWAYYCREIVFEGNEVLPYMDWLPSRKTSIENRLLPVGAFGILYPPGCFDRRVIDKSLFLNLCPGTDDIWFKIMSVINGTISMQVYEDAQVFPYINQSQDVGIFHENIDDEKNTENINKALTHFSLTPENFS